MITTPTYEVNLYLNGTIIGDVRKLAQGLEWSKRRTRTGVDTIDFTVNDVLLAQWCVGRGVTINDLLKPIALECRVVRNGVPVVGGFLATVPAYSPMQTSANLALRFDGFLNLLDGVYLAPGSAVTGKMGALIEDWITYADNKAESYGKAYGFTAGTISDMASVTQTFENYTSVKHVIVNRCDNITGAGPFDIYFHPDKTYDIFKDNEFGDVIDDYIIYYPARLNNTSAVDISAQEVSGFASAVLGVGAGEISEDGSSSSEAPTSFQVNEDAVQEFGYFETVLQESSVSVQDTLDKNTASKLATTSSGIWQPQVQLMGNQIAPTPSGETKIWVGDTVTIQNNEDLTGMTSGQFRVNELVVKVTATNAETVTPTLARGDASANITFAQEIKDIRNELLALKTAR